MSDVENQANASQGRSSCPHPAVAALLVILLLEGALLFFDHARLQRDLGIFVVDQRAFGALVGEILVILVVLVILAGLAGLPTFGGDTNATHRRQASRRRGG
jgi:uncharacterized membrane protein YedE/YeeE